MNKKEFTLTFEDDGGELFTYDVIIEWGYEPTNPDYPLLVEGYMEILNWDELPGWITEEMVFNKLDASDFMPDTGDEDYEFLYNR